MILLTLLAAVTSVAWAGDEASSASKESVWNVTVEQDQKKQGEETSETMRLRVFDDVDRLPPDEYPGKARPGIAVDVEAEMITCPDGNTRIENVNVGGKDFDIEGECERARRGNKITLEREATPAETDERSTTTADE